MVIKKLCHNLNHHVSKTVCQELEHKSNGLPFLICEDVSFISRDIERWTVTETGTDRYCQPSSTVEHLIIVNEQKVLMKRTVFISLALVINRQHSAMEEKIFELT